MAYMPPDSDSSTSSIIHPSNFGSDMETGGTFSFAYPMSTISPRSDGPSRKTSDGTSSGKGKNGKGMSAKDIDRAEADAKRRKVQVCLRADGSAMTEADCAKSEEGL